MESLSILELPLSTQQSSGAGAAVPDLLRLSPHAPRPSLGPWGSCLPSLSRLPSCKMPMLAVPSHSGEVGRGPWAGCLLLCSVFEDKQVHRRCLEHCLNHSQVSARYYYLMNLSPTRRHLGGYQLCAIMYFYPK